MISVAAYQHLAVYWVKISSAKSILSAVRVEDKKIADM